MPRQRPNKREKAATSLERKFWSWSKITLPNTTRKTIIVKLVDALYEKGLLTLSLRFKDNRELVDAAIEEYIGSQHEDIVDLYVRRREDMCNRLRQIIVLRKKFYRPRTPSMLESLPVEVILTIGDFMGFMDVFRCSLASKKLNEKLTRSRDARLRGYRVIPPQSAYEQYDNFGNENIDPPPHYEEPMLIVIKKGWSRMLRTLIRNGISVDSVTLMGHTLLHTAITLGKDECCRVLLEEGANTKLLDRELTWSPLFTAMSHKSNMIFPLIEYGACLARLEGMELQDLPHFGEIQDWAAGINLEIDDVLNTEVEEDWDLAPLTGP